MKRLAFLVLLGSLVSGCAAGSGTDSSQAQEPAATVTVTALPTSIKTTLPTSAAPDAHAPTQTAAPQPQPQPQPQPTPTWDGQGYTAQDYADRVGDVPIWIGYVRRDSAANLSMTVGVDLAGLGHRFAEIGVPPPPPGVAADYWQDSTRTLALFSQMAADEWISGDTTSAMARFEVVVDNSNELIAKVNGAFNFHIRQSETAAAASSPSEASGTAWPGTSLSTRFHGQFRDDVVMVQARLNQLNYGPMPVDGDYGPVTESWVRSYQSDHGLFVDGVVGPVTWASLFA